MSTSTTSSNRFSLVENWDTETLIIFLRDLNINLDEDDAELTLEYDENVVDDDDAIELDFLAL